MYILYICLIHIYIYRYIYRTHDVAFFHVQRPTEVPKFAAAPQQRFSQGVWKSLDFFWRKKIPERFPNWKFEDVFFGCLILVLFNDFAHLPWADTPKLPKKRPRFERLSLQKQLPRLRHGLMLTFSTQLYVEASQVSGSGFHMTHLSEHCYK